MTCDPDAQNSPAAGRFRPPDARTPGYAACHFAAHACTTERSRHVCLCLLSLTPLQGQSRVVELNDAGWKALHDGYSDKAAKLFAEALTLRPNDPVLLMGAGVAPTNAETRRTRWPV